MGEVYRARDLRLGREVALKVLAAPLTQDPRGVERFVREARAASALNHPNIVTVLDIGESEAGHFLVMELVEGRTLRALIAERPSVDVVLRIGEQMARALAAAHAAGIVHRDIKPENVLVRDDGYVKVVDFGLARLLPQPVSSSSAATTFATEIGTRLGTVRYMAPEQAVGDTVTPAVDMFALALVLYELVTGQHAFRSESQVGILRGVLSESPIPPSRLNPELHPALDALLLHMLDKDPRQRPTAAEAQAILTVVASARPAASALAGMFPAGSISRHTVGRATERGELRAAFGRAAAGHGGLLTIAGEPGMGKTTLVEEFLTDLALAGPSCAIAQGRCSERLAGTEAYLPWLEALETLLHGPASNSVARAMKTLAPSWYVQVAPLVADDPSGARLMAQAQAGSQERRKRELAAFVLETSRLQPLVLLLDDLHWADASTIDLLAYLAAKLTSTRILVVATYRESDLRLANHPFLSVKLDLEARGICRELRLEFLTVEDVARYLTLECPGHAFPADFATFLHAKTEGSPLFLVDLLRYLGDRHTIVQKDGRWVLAQALATIEHDVPASVSSLIQRKIDRLGDADRRVLVAASVQGYEFDAAVVAEALALEPSDVEERLDGLERVHAFVRRVREEELPDRTLTLRCRFVHVLYQNTLYASLTPSRRASLSAAVAQAIVRHHGDQSGVLASQLALLFETARDFARACDCFLLAARSAARVSAAPEVVGLSRHGLAVVKVLADGPEKIRRELDFQMTLGPALIATKGYGAHETEQTYQRARELCQALGDGPELFPILWGLWAFAAVRAQIPAACELLDQLRSLADRQADPALSLEAHFAHGDTFLWLGRFPEARAHLEQGIAQYDASRHSSLAFTFVMDPGVACRNFLAHVLWYLGYPDQALKSSDDALATAQHLGHRHSLLSAFGFRTWLHEYRQEVDLLQQTSEAILKLAAEGEAAMGRAHMMILTGWALVRQGRHEEGLAQMHQGLQAYRATGAELERVHWLALLAEAYQGVGQATLGLDALNEALDTASRTGIRFCEAELYRLKGELLEQVGTNTAFHIAAEHRVDVSEQSGLPDAEVCFRRGIEIARQQMAKSLELRAVTSLSRLLARTDRRDEAHQMLTAIYGWFTEGFETRDLQDARALLQELSVARRS
jgi:predicted ATPase